jgi:ABC-type amino acid transport substrate-binding protein
MRLSIAASAIVCALVLLFASLAANAAPSAQVVPNPPGDWDRIRDAGKLVIGTSADYPPFEFYNSNFEMDGFDIALARALGKELGLEVEFNDYGFDGLLDQVQLGNVDAGDCRHFGHTRTQRTGRLHQLLLCRQQRSRRRADLHAGRLPLPPTWPG